MTYNNFIQNIINSRGQWNIPSTEYYEKHHILAACLGGDGDYTGKNGRSYFYKNSHHPNCIYLYADEHFIAHFLLVRENPKQIKFLYPLILMSNYSHVNEEKAFNLIEENLGSLALEYKSYKEKYAYSTSGINSPNYGKILSDTTKLKISKNRQGKGIKEHHWCYNKHLPTEIQQKISNALTGKTLDEFPNDILENILAVPTKNELKVYHEYVKPNSSNTPQSGGKNGKATIRYFYDNLIFNCRDDFIYYINLNVDKKLTESTIRRVQNGKATYRAYREHKEVFDNVMWGYKNEN